MSCEPNKVNMPTKLVCSNNHLNPINHGANDNHTMIAREKDGDHKDCDTAFPDQTQTRAIERMENLQKLVEYQSNTRVPLFRTNRDMCQFAERYAGCCEFVERKRIPLFAQTARCAGLLNDMQGAVGNPRRSLLTCLECCDGSKNYAHSLRTTDLVPCSRTRAHLNVSTMTLRKPPLHATAS